MDQENNNINENPAQNSSENSPQKEKEKVIKQYQELKNYKCTPTIKRNIRSSQSSEGEKKEILQFNSIGFQPSLKEKIIFTGSNENTIYLWDYVKEGKIGLVRNSSNQVITKIIFDKNFIITGGDNGYIDIWNVMPEEVFKKNKYVLNLIKTLSEPYKKGMISPKINDLLMLKNVGLLVSCDNGKKINLWKYQNEKTKELIHTIKKDKEVTCLACDESYGKLLCGTVEKVIMEIDLAEELNAIGFKHSYEKYAFLKNSVNYKEDEIDKKIDNFKIMKSLTQGIGP